MSAALPLVAQALLLAPAPIVFIAFAAVLTGSFNVRMALLTEALAGSVSNVAQKKAFLNSPDTKLKENIRKRHEKYLRNVIFSIGLLRKHLQWIRTGAYLVLISFLFFVTATMLHVLKPYNIYLAYPATILLWIGMLLDVVAVLLIFVDLWTSYAHLNNENLLIYKIKKMIIEDFKATGQLPADTSAVQMDEHKTAANEDAFHDEVNELVLKNAHYRSEAENEMNIQQALTMKNVPISTSASPDVDLSAKSGEVATKQTDKEDISNQYSSSNTQDHVEKLQTAVSEKMDTNRSDKSSSSTSSSDSSSSINRDSTSRGDSSDSSIDSSQ